MLKNIKCILTFMIIACAFVAGGVDAATRTTKSQPNSRSDIKTVTARATARNTPKKVGVKARAGSLPQSVQNSFDQKNISLVKLVLDDNLYNNNSTLQKYVELSGGSSDNKFLYLLNRNGTLPNLSGLFNNYSIKGVYTNANDTGTSIYNVSSGTATSFNGDKLYMLSKGSSSSPTGCPSADDTITAWNAYRDTTVDNIGSTNVLRYVRGATQKSDYTDCAIIVRDADGVCRMAKYNTTSKAYGSCYNSVTKKASTLCVSDFVVACDKDNSDVDARLYVSTNSTGINAKYSNEIYEWFIMGIEYGKTLPTLEPIVNMNTYAPHAVFMGGYNRAASGIGDGKPIIGDSMTQYWDSTGKPIKTVSDITEFQYHNTQKSYYAEMLWDNSHGVIDDCPTLDEYGGYAVTEQETFVRNVSLSTMSWVVPLADCAVITRGNDGLCWLSSNDRHDREYVAVRRAMDCNLDYYTINANGYLPWAAGDSWKRTIYINGDSNGKIVTPTYPDGIYKSIEVLYQWENDSTKDFVFPDLSGLVSNMEYYEASTLVTNKKFAGINSKSDGSGEWYYDANGVPAQKTRNINDVSRSMYMVWEDEETP